MDTPDEGGFWTEQRFRLGAYAGTVVMFFFLLWLRFDYTPEPPRMPPRPPDRPRDADVQALNYSQGLYDAGVEKDASDYAAGRVTREDLTHPLPHTIETVHKPLMPADPPIETAQLRLKTRREKLTVDTGRGTFTGEHLVLDIENISGKHLAYRIDTIPTFVQKCLSKGDITHNAMALAPGAKTSRTECVYRSGLKFLVERIETVEINPLSYHYVSRLYPPHLGGDARSTRGHQPPKGEVCKDIPEQSIRRGMQRGEVTWRDVVDFYARHNCEKFIFPPGYKAFEKKDQYSLPVSRETVGRGAAP